MKLVWKLLRQHISVGQFAGFFFANLAGMLIVLFGYQFYKDVLPVFTQEDSFMKSDYLIVSKHISSASGRSNTFSAADIDDLSAQPFSTKVGRFTSTEYKADATMGVQGQTVLHSEMFFESVPDDFIDAPLTEWTYTPGSHEVPVIIPRTYINMYNFGFAQTHSMPKISEGLMGMIDFQIFIHHNGRQEEYKGKVIGFSSRMSSILVPQSFMLWSNDHYAPGQSTPASRLLLEVRNPADDHITSYLDSHGYEVESEQLDAEKTTYFLRMIVVLVMAIGIVISVLSFYILMLSIYLLVQKNTTKLENLLLLGYSPALVARPYQLLTLGLNIAVLLIALIALSLMRRWYLNFIYAFYPTMQETSFLPAIAIGLLILLFVTILNFVVIRRKVTRIWQRKE